MHRGQIICDKVWKTVENMSINCGNEVVVSSNLKCEVNETEDLDSFKIEQTYFVSLLSKSVESTVHLKKLSQVEYLKEKLKSQKGCGNKSIEFVSQLKVKWCHN
jgi:hypothetical protein